MKDENYNYHVHEKEHRWHYCELFGLSILERN